MLNIILFVLLAVSVLCGFISGNADNITTAITGGATEAVQLCLSMGAGIAFWSGVMNVAEKSGITEKIAALVSPIMRFVFPISFKDRDCRNAITMNVTSNLLGLGNAATPMGIKALKLMQKGDQKPKKEAVRFLVMNCASLQLLPTTVAAIRGASGCATPFDILIPVWVVSLLTMVFSLILCEICTLKDKG